MYNNTFHGGGNVLKYIVLGKWTDQGRKTLDEASERIKAIKKLVEELDGSLNLYYTFGEYDLVAILELPDEDSMAKILIKINSMQSVTTKTLRAWTDTEFVNMVSQI